MEGNGLVAPTLLHDLITPRCFLLSQRDGRVPLLMFVKDEVVMLVYHAYLYIYLLLFSRWNILDANRPLRVNYENFNLDYRINIQGA